MLSNRRTFVSTLATLAGGQALAQTPPFPSKVIRMVPFGTAGGPIDTLARVYADKLQARWGQPSSSTPSPAPAASSQPTSWPSPARRPHRDVHAAADARERAHPAVQGALRPGARLHAAVDGGQWRPDAGGARQCTLQQREGVHVDFARKAGKPLSYGTWGTGSTAHLFGELLKRQSGAELTHVPYKAEAAAHNDLFGEALDFAWANPASARNHTQAGKMKVLGITGTRRVSIMPNVPTFAEQGLQGFDIDSWIGIYAPARLPADIQDAWVTALREITAMPDVSARLTAFGFEPLGNTPAQFMERYKADYPRMAELIKAAGVTGE
jgi:tripartite-type tricarboxylate transporter receptor subunit TctC